MNTIQILCVIAVITGIITDIPQGNFDNQQFHIFGYQDTPRTKQHVIPVSSAITNSNSTIAMGGTTNSELDILRSINETNSEILTKMEKLVNTPAVDSTRIISSYLSVVSFLIAVATFILAFFLNREFDGKLSDEMKKYWRLIALGLILPCVYMIGHGIYLIITELNSIPYLISLTLTSVPILILLHLTRKKVR